MDAQHTKYPIWNYEVLLLAYSLVFLQRNTYVNDVFWGSATPSTKYVLHTWYVLGAVSRE